MRVAATRRRAEKSCSHVSTSRRASSIIPLHFPTDARLPSVLFSSLGRILRLLVAIGLTVYALWRAHPGAVLEALSRTDATWIAFAIALVAVDRTLMAGRWILLLAPIAPAQRPPLPALVRVFLISTFAGTFLPASVGGDIVRAYGLAQLRVSAGEAVASVLMDRLLGVVSILLVGILGLVTGGTSDLVSAHVIEWPLVVGSVVTAAAGSMVFVPLAATLVERVFRDFPIEIVKRIGVDSTRAVRAYHRHRGALLNVLAGSIAVQIL